MAICCVLYATSLAGRVDAASRELARAESELRSAEDVAALRATGRWWGGGKVEEHVVKL